MTRVKKTETMRINSTLIHVELTYISLREYQRVVLLQEFECGYLQHSVHTKIFVEKEGKNVFLCI